MCWVTPTGMFPFNVSPPLPDAFPASLPAKPAPASSPGLTSSTRQTMQSPLLDNLFSPLNPMILPATTASWAAIGHIQGSEQSWDSYNNSPTVTVRTFYTICRVVPLNHLATLVSLQRRAYYPLVVSILVARSPMLHTRTSYRVEIKHMQIYAMPITWLGQSLKVSSAIFRLLCGSLHMSELPS